MLCVVAPAYCEVVLNACSPEAPHDGDDLKLAWGRRGGMGGGKSIRRRRRRGVGEMEEEQEDEDEGGAWGKSERRGLRRKGSSGKVGG